MRWNYDTIRKCWYGQEYDTTWRTHDDGNRSPGRVVRIDRERSWYSESYGYRVMELTGPDGQCQLLTGPYATVAAAKTAAEVLLTPPWRHPHAAQKETP